MAIYKCTDGNEIEILEGTLSDEMKRQIGIIVTGEAPFVCEQCGDCCIWCHIPVHPVFAADPRVPEWLAARGAELQYEKATIDGAPVVLPFLTFKLPCPYLVSFGMNGKTACSLHKTKKPEACKQYRCDRDPILLKMQSRKKENDGHEF